MHQHNCQCDHKKVKFCAGCNTVYCLDCRQEWSPKLNWNWNQQSTSVYPFTSQILYGGGGLGNATLTTTSVCEHET